MSQTGKFHKFFVDDNNQITIACPKCGFLRTFDITKFLGKSSKEKVTYKCKHSFYCLIEFRKHYRKPVSLAGNYYNILTMEYGKIDILDLSLGGLSFQPTTKKHNISIDDMLDIRFILDDKNKTQINRQVIVKNIRTHSIGASFSTQKDLDKDLWFYLMA